MVFGEPSGDGAHTPRAGVTKTAEGLGAAAGHSVALVWPETKGHGRGLGGSTTTITMRARLAARTQCYSKLIKVSFLSEISEAVSELIMISFLSEISEAAFDLTYSVFIQMSPESECHSQIWANFINDLNSLDEPL